MTCTANIKILKDYRNIAHSFAGVLCIGNFDGVHLGHQALIAAGAAKAQALGVDLGILTFDPHPRRFFDASALPFQITSLEQKAEIMGALGVTHIFALPFDAALAGMEAQAFIDDVLVTGLAARVVVVGADFAFGKKRGGNVETLRACKKFETLAVEKAGQGCAVYGSRNIRTLIESGDLETAYAHMGRPFALRALVISGDKRGRELGYPTANQKVDDYVRLPFGVYAVRVRLEGEANWRDGVASFGLRPMFALKTPLFETFIFDFDADIYGKNMDVMPVKRLRSEMNFNDLAGLVRQIEQDCLAATTVLQSAHDFK